MQSDESDSVRALADAVAELLTRELGQTWTVQLPGVALPREAWLHGPVFDAAAVGVFVGRVVVSEGLEPRTFTIDSPAELPTRGTEIVVAVRSQLAAYERNLELAKTIRAHGDRLARALGEGCRVQAWHQPSHWRTIEARLLRDSDLLALVYERDGEIRVHAGLVGDDGYDRRADEAEPEAILAALELETRTLTIDRLTRGERYRVLANLGDLRKGMIVEFVGFDDIDNHYGIYQFRGADGKTLDVGGDYSRKEHSPLAQAHRYLERIPG